MPLSTQNLPNFLSTLAKLSNNGARLRLKESIWPQLVSKMSTNKQTEREQDIGLVSPISALPEMAPYQEMTLGEQYPQSYTQVQFGGMMQITKPMVKFSQEDLIKRCQSGMLDSSKDSKEIQIAAMYEYGYTGATVPTIANRPMFNQLAADGQAYFSAAHTFRDSTQTFSNLSTNGDDITEWTLNTYATAIRRWKNQWGMPNKVRPVSMLIPPEMVQKVHKVLESALEPSTNNNAINTTKYFMKDSFIVNEFLSATGTWYILTDDTESRPKVYMGWDDETRTDLIGLNGNSCVYLDYSWAIGFGGAWGAYRIGSA